LPDARVDLLASFLQNRRVVSSSDIARSTVSAEVLVPASRELFNFSRQREYQKKGRKKNLVPPFVLFIH
jgi:hypothetical protein